MTLREGRGFALGSRVPDRFAVHGVYAFMHGLSSSTPLRGRLISSTTRYYPTQIVGLPWSGPSRRLCTDFDSGSVAGVTAIP
jgi:hypothetical protein